MTGNPRPDGLRSIAQQMQSVLTEHRQREEKARPYYLPRAKDSAGVVMIAATERGLWAGADFILLRDLIHRVANRKVDQSRARRFIMQQRRFTQSASDRFSPLLFARSEDFEDSLQLFKLRVEARGQGWDIYEGWRDRFQRAKSATREELEDERRRVRTKKKRRRRRRGRGGSVGRRD